MKILNSKNRNFYSELDKIINKRKQVNKFNLKIVEKIINNVRKNQDQALIAYERKFNNNSKIIPSKKEITQAIKLLDPKIKTAIDETYKRVKDWHLKQKPKDIFSFECLLILALLLLREIPCFFSKYSGEYKSISLICLTFFFLGFIDLTNF